jgi:glycosyltransferase involved in cell wall biosynthesis
VFFAPVSDRRLVDLLEFYSEDVQIFGELGYEVRVETRAWSAMLAGGDVLYAWWWTWSLPVVATWRLRRLPSIVTGALGFRVPFVPPTRRLAERVLTGLCTRVAGYSLAVSEHELPDIRRTAPRSSGVLHHSVDTDFFVAGTEASQPTAITVGQVNPLSIRRKGIDLSIAATALVRKSLPGFRLQVVGPVTEEGRRWLAEARDTMDFEGVDICGEVTRVQKRDLLASAWVYLQPSLYEGFGLAMVEAMACGCPVVSSSGGALPEVVGSGGVVLDQPTIESMAAAIVGILESPSRRAELRERARRRSLDFARPVRRKGLEAALNQVMGSRHGGGIGRPA